MSVCEKSSALVAYIKTRIARTNTSTRRALQACAHVPCKPMSIYYNNNYTLVSHFSVLRFPAWNVRSYLHSYTQALALFYRILIIFAEKSVENVAHVNLDVSVCVCAEYTWRRMWILRLMNGRHRWNENDRPHCFAGYMKIHFNTNAHIIHSACTRTFLKW